MSQKTTLERYISGIVTLQDNKTVHIICVHLDYKYEPTRIYTSFFIALIIELVSSTDKVVCVT